VANTISQCKV